MRETHPDRDERLYDEIAAGIPCAHIRAREEYLRLRRIRQVAARSLSTR